jgi:hypothetical protein
MAQSLITNSYRYNSADNFVKTFSSGGVNGNYYYVFAGNHLDYANTTISKIYDNVYTTINDVYKNMIFGKLVQNTDVSLMIRRVPWASGTVYAMYDDKDATLSLKDFFVYVHDGGFYQIFKCLNNNKNGPSTIEPSLSSIGTDGIQYNPTDGYMWKYMYSVDDTTFDKFATDKFIPLVANTTVIDNAVEGSINSIKINGAGAGYNNYIANGTFSVSDIGVESNSSYYAISIGGASATDDYYKGCILLITSGTGAGQARPYRTIMKYTGGNAYAPRYVQLDSPFTVQPDNSSTYSIYPGVYITGDKSETTEAVAWAYINSSGNTVSRVEMLEPGANYKIAIANVYASDYVSIISQASVTPILSPPGGHGSNPGNELYCQTVTISTKFANTEANTIPSSNKFRQIGVLRNPKFSSATITYPTSNTFYHRGSFSEGETVYNFYPKKFQNFVNIGIDTTNANAEYDGMFTTVLESNSMIYVSDGTSDAIFTVNSITNNSVLVLNETSPIGFSNATMYILDTQAYGTVTQTSGSNIITISNITGHIQEDAVTVGSTTGAYARNITNINRNDENKQFDTFVQAYRYTGTINSGTFTNNEDITQIADQVANAILHSTKTSGDTTTFYMTNQNGIFNTSDIIYGNTSHAIATLYYKYLPELIFGSGDVLYLENLDPITRSNTQTETFKLIFEF